MTRDSDDMMAHWLRTVQAMDIGDRPMMNPARTSQSVGEIVKEAGGGLTFDAEPAGYYKLLQELKPGQS